MLGILVATVLNHAFASWVGVWITNFVSPTLLKWILAGSFIAFGVWMLSPDEEEEVSSELKWGPFLTTAVLFFIAEMGDKTQLATVALGAKFSAPWLVTAGTTLGMLVADGLAVVFGHRIAAALFIAFGIGILLGY